MSQCDCLTDHGINLPIQFKSLYLIAYGIVQFLHCTYMYLYITLTPFGHTNWPPDMAVAHKFSILSTPWACVVLPWAVLKPIIQLLQEVAYYSKSYSRIFGPDLILGLESVQITECLDVWNYAWLRCASEASWLSWLSNACLSFSLHKHLSSTPKCQVASQNVCLAFWLSLDRAARLSPM